MRFYLKQTGFKILFETGIDLTVRAHNLPSVESKEAVQTPVSMYLSPEEKYDFHFTLPNCSSLPEKTVGLARKKFDVKLMQKRMRKK